MYARMTNFDEAVKTLTGQSQQLVTDLETHFKTFNDLEANYKNHIEHNFAVVEHEYNKIKSVIQGVHDQAGESTGANAIAAQCVIQNEPHPAAPHTHL